jgi:membrane protease YdiL (CAAX protease family)
MTPERFDKRDMRRVVFLLAVAAMSVAYTAYNFKAAFPQASINLRYSKDQISSMAGRFLNERGLRVDGFHQLTLFDPDQTGSLYLERELGLEEANRLMRAEVPVWRWRARWFRPPDKEEMTVWLSPEGRLVGFEHQIRETDAGARLTKEQARAIAERFLRQQTSTPQRFIEEQLQERPNRYDYLFTWEQEGFKAKEATNRRSVTVQGDQVGAYQEFLHVPEKWKRDFATMRAANDLYSQIATGLYVPLILGALVLIIIWIRRKDLDARSLLVVSTVVGGLMMLNEWNQLPFFIDQTSTSTPYYETLAIGLLRGLGAGVFVFLYVILAAAAGEPLYRRAQPGQLSLASGFAWRGLRSKRAFDACVVGYAFAAVHIAFVVAFYLIGRKFGVWSPQEVEYSDLLSTLLPWIYPVAISLLAATSEEFWFRLFAVPALQRIVKWRWLAIVVPAFVWGFLHSNYPQQPGYIRGIEVGVIGIAAGYLMMRYGILSTLIWHFTVDAVLIGMFLFRSESGYFQLSGLVVVAAILAPLAISLISYRRNGGFITVPEALNEGARLAETPVAAPVEPPVEPVAEPVTAPAPARLWRAKWFLVAGALGAVAVVALRPFEFGDFVRVGLTRGEAEKAADRAMTGRNLKPADWRRVTEFIANFQVSDFEYLRRLAGRTAANDAVRDRATTGVWMVRYFQPLKKEEWRVFVNSGGNAFRLDHVVDEKAAGANLSAEEARAIALRYAADAQRVDLSRYRALDAATEKKDHRTDHDFVWEDPDFKIGEAKARISVSVQGDEPSSFRRFLKLPEEWLREFERPRVQNFLIVGLIGALALPLVFVFVKRLPGHEYRWRVYLVVAGVACGLALLANLNQWPVYLAAYETAKPLENYFGQAIVGRLIGALFFAGAGLLGALAVDVFLRVGIEDRRIEAPSLVSTIALALVVAGFSRLAGVAGDMIGGPRLSVRMWSIAGTDVALPGFAVLAQAVFAALGWVAAAVIVLSAAARLVKPRMRLAILATVVIIAALGRALTPAQFAVGALVSVCWMALFYALLKTRGADVVGLGVAVFWLETASRAATMMAQPSFWFQWNGAAAALLAAIAGVLAIRIASRRLRASSGE